ncbi:MAG TPA: hypothetical protein VFL79_03820 [Terriglobia bacterium]|nr:hypothetical protein [Terriglobia bacterium]
METLLIAICAAVFLLAVAVFSPVVIAVDSRKRQLRIRWLLALEFQMPLPWTKGRKFLKAFGKPFPVREKQPAAAKKEQPAGAGAAVQKPGKRRATGRFFVRCLGDASIRRALARQLSMLLRRIFRSVDLRGLASDVSLPDPALNGLLAGALAVTNAGRRQAIRMNFKGENSLLLELRFHPHRIFKAFLYFLPGLPYRAVFRQWRAFSAARPH